MRVGMRMGVVMNFWMVMRTRSVMSMRVGMNMNGGLSRGWHRRVRMVGCVIIGVGVVVAMVVRMIMVVVVRNGVVVVVATHAVCDSELAVFAAITRHT